MVNYFRGKCHVAESPLLGSTGSWGEHWTLLGNKLLAEGRFDVVILVPLGVDATESERWSAGDVRQLLVMLLEELRQRYRVTHVLWQQGEADQSRQVDQSTYERNLVQVALTLRQHGVEVPMHIAVETACDFSWSPANPVALAQRALAQRPGFAAGPNIDNLLSAIDRYDGCHFSATGQEKVAAAWLSIIGR